MALSVSQKLNGYGMPYPQVVELVSQIGATADAVALTHVGFPAPVAKELASQITLSGSPPTGATARLVACGMGGRMAGVITAAIAAAA